MIEQTNEQHSQKKPLLALLLLLLGGSGGAVAYYLWWSKGLNTKLLSVDCARAVTQSSRSLLTLNQSPTGGSADKTSDQDTHVGSGSCLSGYSGGIGNVNLGPSTQLTPVGSGGGQGGSSIGGATQLSTVSQQPQPPQNPKYTYSEDDIHEYLGARYINLFADLRTKEDPKTNSIVKGGGFILGSATEKTNRGEEGVYYVGVDIDTYLQLTSYKHTITPYYGFRAFDSNANNQNFWRLSIDDEWSYAALGVQFTEKPDGYTAKSDDQFGVGFGVLLMDLQPSISSRYVGRQRSESRPKLNESLLSQYNDEHLKRLKESIDKYGDVSFTDKVITKGYMLDQSDSNSPISTSGNTRQYKAKEISNITGQKRPFNEDDKVTVESRDIRTKIISQNDYWFPVYDWNAGDQTDGLGSPLFTYDDTDNTPKNRIKFGGIVTKPGSGSNSGLVTQIMRESDYDPITKSPQKDSGRTLCDKITSTTSPSTWLRGAGRDNTQLRVPTFCS